MHEKMTSSTMPTLLTHFMKSPLVTWIKTFREAAAEEEKELDFKGLCDGVFLYNVWLQIDPHPLYHGLVSTTDDVCTKIRNLDVLLHNIRAFYEEVLGQLLLIKNPDIIILGRQPMEEVCIGEMQALLLLLLGSAVQCDRKQTFIENIKSLDLEVQHSIVDCIKQITDNPEAVWLSEWNELSNIPPEEQKHMYGVLVSHLRRLLKERDELSQRLVSLVMDRESQSGVPSPPGGPTTMMTIASPVGSTPDKPHLQVELADAKSRLRKLQQELEEKTEVATELKEELEHTKENLNKLRQENLELIQDARTAKAYRDEIDILNERVRRVDRLESDLQRYKDRMNELEFYKTRVEEIREDNRILMNTKTILEEQLETTRKKVEQLEADKRRLCTEFNDLSIEQDVNRERILCLLEEIGHLQVERKAGVEELSQLQSEILHLRHSSLAASSSLCPSLLEQLNTDAQTRVFQLELENQRLRGMVAEISPSSPQTEKLLEETSLEKQKLKRDLDISNQRLGDVQLQNAELEKMIEELRHNVKNEKKKGEQLETSMSSLTTENQKLQRSCEFLQRKSEELQRELQSLESENLKLTRTAESLRLSVKRLNDLERESTQLEADNHRLEQEKKGLEKETQRLKYASEIKDTTIDNYAARLSSLERDSKRLQKELETCQALSMRLKQLEKENKDLEQQAAVDTQTITTLRQELVNEKIKCQQQATEIAHLSSCVAELESKKNQPPLQQLSADHQLEEALHDSSESSSSLDSLRREEESRCMTLKQKNSELKATIAELEKKCAGLEKSSQSQISTYRDTFSKQQTEQQAEMARREVESATLEAHNQSLADQLAATRGSLALLEEETDQLRKQRNELEVYNASLLSHNEHLQKLHNLLTSDFECLKNNYSSLKSEHKILRQENASLKETLDSTLFSQEQVLRLQKVFEEENTSRSSVMLRSENNQLKEQVRSIQESQSQLVGEHRELQNVNRSLRTENNELKLRCTELQGDLAESRSGLAAAEIEAAKLASYCELLSQRNQVLEEDQQKLLQHVSMLLSRYHDMLASMSSEREPEPYLQQNLRDLCQQKEMLEHWIAEHCNQLEKSSKRKHIAPNNLRQIRRTRSAFLKGSSHKEGTSSESPTRLSLTRSKHSLEELSKDDLIPVRDEDSNKQGKHHYHTTVETHTTINHITNLGTTPKSSPQHRPNHRSSDSPVEPLTPNPVWYEYGCV